MNARDIPNLITFARIFLTVPVGWSLVVGRYDLALVLFAVAGSSDALDGFLAKQFRWQSRLGGLLDPLADKLLLVTSFVGLGVRGDLPAWLVLLVILRDVVIVSGAVIYHFHVARLDPEPLLVSKLNTLVQILLVLAVVFNGAVGSLGVLAPLPGWLIDSLLWLTLATTLASGAAYVIEWSRRTARHGEG